MLISIVGPHRMRKKMIRNDLFYLHYPYHGENDAEVSFVIAVIGVLRNAFFLKFDTHPPPINAFGNKKC